MSILPSCAIFKKRDSLIFDLGKSQTPHGFCKQEATKRATMVKKKLKKTTLEERKQRFSSQSALILLLGISVGYLLSVAWRDQQHLFQTLDRVGSMTVYSSSSSSSNDDDGDDNAAADLRKLQRFWKYAHTYYYIPAAARYDYVPVPAQECGSGPDFAPWWKLNQYDRSRLDEDKFIYETFFKKKHPQPGEEAATDDNFHFHFNGTYVELGAFNGRQESNTRFFDLCLGWKGLLLEGNPENYQQTIRNRQFAHKMSLAPSCSAEYEAVNHTIPFFRYPMTNVGLVGHAKTYTGKPTVEVPCGPLSPVLADIFAAEEETDNSQPQHSAGGVAILPTVDFFSLDVEGSEDLVLSTIDFHAVRIHVLMIEIQNNDCKWEGCPVRQRVRAKMAAEGYQRYEKLVHASDIYVHPDSPFQIPDSIAVPNV